MILEKKSSNRWADYLLTTRHSDSNESVDQIKAVINHDILEIGLVNG